MNMGQRTSSAAELKGHQGNSPIGEAFSEAVKAHKFELRFIETPVVGSYHFEPSTCDTIGEFALLRGFYYDSHADRREVTVVTPKADLSVEDIQLTGLVTVGRSCNERYFLCDNLARLIASTAEEPLWYRDDKVFFSGRSYNSMVDLLEDRDQVTDFEEKLVIVTQSGGVSPDKVQILGITEIFIPKRGPALIHVVAEVERATASTQPFHVYEEQLINPRYYVSEKIAGYVHRDLKADRKPLESMEGRNKSAMIAHLS